MNIEHCSRQRSERLRDLSEVLASSGLVYDGGDIDKGLVDILMTELKNWYRRIHFTLSDEGTWVCVCFVRHE